jgi:Na+(H+)/acetate symporter ActP
MNWASFVMGFITAWLLAAALSFAASFWLLTREDVKTTDKEPPR